MFACIFVKSKTPLAGNEVAEGVEGIIPDSLLDLAYCFSPLIEETSADTLVLNLDGTGVLFNSYREIAAAIAERARSAGHEIDVAIANDPDTAIHVARHIGGVTYIPPSEEPNYLADLQLDALDYSLVRIDAVKAAEILETLRLWGIGNFGGFAALPEKGVAERLGQEGLKLQRLAKGANCRQLVARKIKPEFEYSIDLEHHLEELEPLSFVLSRLLNQVCASLEAVGFATNELWVSFKLEKGEEYFRTINFPFPGRDSKTFLKLLLLNIESDPPTAPVAVIYLGCRPVRPRVVQHGLFQPLAPEPDKLQLTLARIRNMVGSENLGAIELLDTHRPDSFSIRRFDADTRRKRRKSRQVNRNSLMGFRRYRPLLEAEVQTVNGRPVRIKARDSLRRLNGEVVKIAGPWRTTGGWWSENLWARDEWDLSVKDSSRNETLYRVFHETQSDKWYVEGAYD
jgi:protein ImuB